MKILLLALAALPAVATAQTPAAPAERPAKHRPPMRGAPMDPTSFCYFAGEAYSPGASLAGKVCATRMGVAVNPMGPAPKLSWETDRTAR